MNLCSQRESLFVQKWPLLFWKESLESDSTWREILAAIKDLDFESWPTLLALIAVFSSENLVISTLRVFSE